MVNGDVAACEHLVRISNLVERKEGTLRARAAAAGAKKPIPLHERIGFAARKGGEQ